MIMKIIQHENTADLLKNITDDEVMNVVKILQERIKKFRKENKLS